MSAGLSKFDEFELDCDRYELLRGGHPLRLEKIPMELLILLVAKNGHLVTRQEIVEHLWGSDVFVDTEHGINTAIRKIRQVLRDDPEQPRFVQTVTGKGYRFIAAVTAGGNGSGGQASAGPGPLPRRSYRFAGQEPWSPKGLSSEILPPLGNGDGQMHPADRTGLCVAEPAGQEGKLHAVGKRVAWLVVGALVLLLAAAVIVKRTQPARLAIRDTIVVADFTNTTGDAIFDDTLKTALSVSLRQSPFLNILSDGEVSQTLQLMTRPIGAKLTPEIAHELCQRTGSKAYIAGAIAILGSEYVLGLKAVNCQNGEILAQQQVTAASKERVLDSLGGAASTLRGELGESLASVQRFDVPLEQATTSSLEALKAYSLARKANSEKGAVAALPYDMHAIELDPSFAMGYLTAGGDYEDLGQRGRAREYYTRAFQLREHVSEREKLRITAVYYDTVTGELYKAAETYQQEIDSYPRESMAYSSLAYVYSLLGQYEKAMEVARQGMRTLPPDRVESLGGGTIFTSALALQRFDEAQQAIDALQLRKVDDERIRLVRYILAIFGTDPAALAEQQQWFMGRPNFENLVLALASDAHAYAGHVTRARELTRQAVDSALRADSKETAARWQAIAAQREAAYGYAARARQKAAEALKLAPDGQDVEDEVALVLAVVGDTARAESLALDLGKRFPLDTQMQSLWLPTIQAQLALDRKNPALALKRLQVASTIEWAGIPSVINNSCLYHVYVRGEAYLAAGQGSAAAAEFQKILDHRGLVWNCWTGALAHLGVARANALEARASQGADADAARVRARAAYKDFFTLWKDADSNIPILKQAEAEYAKLQ